MVFWNSSTGNPALHSFLRPIMHPVTVVFIGPGVSCSLAEISQPYRELLASMIFREDSTYEN